MTPDPVALTRRAYDAGSRRDLDAVMSFCGPDSVWDMSQMGLGTYSGLQALRAFFEDWMAPYDQFEMNIEEISDLGNGVVFYTVLQGGRLADSAGHVELRYAGFTSWTDGVIARVANFSEADGARSAAERLAEERG